MEFVLQNTPCCDILEPMTVSSLPTPEQIRAIYREGEDATINLVVQLVQVIMQLESRV